jgi:hypothetical protein
LPNRNDQNPAKPGKLVDMKKFMSILCAAIAALFGFFIIRRILRSLAIKPQDVDNPEGGPPKDEPPPGKTVKPGQK